MKQNKVYRPPIFPRWLAFRFISESYREEFFGDLQEIFETRAKEKGIFFARLMYWIDTLHLVAGFATFSFSKSNQPLMISSMAKVAWRNSIRQKQFTVLNIIGLTLGIATCIVTGLYVHDEMSYDTFHANGDRIYRINQPLIWGNWDEQFASTGPNVAIALKEDAPEFEEVTRLLALGEQFVNAPDDEKKFNPITESRIYAADANFFRVFSFEFINGNPITALTEPNTVVITQSTAQRYFGLEDPIGKTLDFKQRDNTWKNFTVTGVLKDIPDRSHLQFDMLKSMESFHEQLQNDGWKWIWTAFSTYGLVKEGVDVQALSHSIQSIPPKWAAVTTERIFNQSYEEFTHGKPWTLYLQPLRKIYLSDAPGNHRFGPTGNPQTVRIFSAIGLLVLALSCINFMNLATARSVSRAKEVGVRKVMGSQRSSLIRQFIFESTLFVALSTILAFLLAHLILPWFNIIAAKNLSLIHYLLDPLVVGGILLFIVALGIVAGSYPAWYLSAFKPIETLKGKIQSGIKGKGIRNGLVIFQFTMSIILVICTFFVQKQLAYTSSMDLGFSKDNILQIHNIEQLGTDAEVLKNKLREIPAVTSVGKSFGLIPDYYEGDGFRPDNVQNPSLYISNARLDEDYLQMLGVEFVAGKNFGKLSSNDKRGVILNEIAVKALGWSNDYQQHSPIGKKVIQAFDREEELEVIGVVKDFNFHSVKQKIEPLMIIHPDNDLFWFYGKGASYLSMRLNPAAIQNPEDLRAVITKVKGALEQIDDTIPFRYSFMDQQFESAFRNESRMSTILNVLTGMALIIACLGLSGLAAFTAEQRTKELGIRKVLGAKVSQLVLLFTSEFTKLIIIAVLVACPVAYFMVNSWLEGFAYRTPIALWVFVVAVSGTLTIAIVTTAYQSLSAAYKNPVETLKEQ